MKVRPRSLTSTRRRSGRRDPYRQASPAGPAPPRRLVCAPDAMSLHSIADRWGGFHMKPRKEETKEQAPQVLKKWPRLRISVIAILIAALVLAVSASRADVEKSKSSNGGTVTKIRANG